MSINASLLNYISGCRRLNEYGLDPQAIKQFLLQAKPFRRRQQLAIDMIDGILTERGKQHLLKAVVELARVERAIGLLQPRRRDHVVHALLSFILGICINEHFLRPVLRVNPFEWKLAGLLHDVAYPVEVGASTCASFTDKINKIRSALGVPGPMVGFEFVPRNIDKLQNGVSAFSLLQDKIDEWGIKVDARKEYWANVRRGQVCHGMLSAMVVLHVIDLLYQHHKWNPKNRRHVVSACAAIFLHNLQKDSFGGSIINRTRAPLAFLLRVSDCLQDWERPSGNDNSGIPSDHFDISISRGKMTLKADVDEVHKTRIRTELAKVLSTRGITVE